MLKTVKDVCVPHAMALDYAMGDQIENLGDLIAKENDGAEFFVKNHITAGMSELLRLGLRRLGGKSDQAVFELTQAMGGGKTHTMIAFGLLARNERLRATIVPDLAAAAPFAGARVVAFSGRQYPDHFLWGEIAAQLGKPAEFARYWQNGPAAPDEDAWLRLIGDEPTLILLDEMPPYFDYAITRPVGGGTLAQVATAALSNLLSAALKLKRLCIVISNLSGTYEGASRELRRAIKNIEQEARRQAKPITPVELGGDEVYQILKKRLFSKLPGADDIETVSQRFAEAIAEAEKSKAIGKSAEQIAAEIRGSYPFHPSIKDIIALFRNNESYRQTRGLMQFVSRMIRSVWARKWNDVHLIGLQHLDLNDSEVREEVLRIADLRGAISRDIAAQGAALAEVIDQKANSDAGSQVATLLLTASLSTSVDAVRGLNRQRLLEHLIAPNRRPLEFSDAFEHLRRDAWYLHRDRGDSFYFSNTENLTKRLSTEAESAPQPKIDAEMRRRLEEIFKPRRRAAYQVLYALPLIDQVKLGGDRVLLILSPDTRDAEATARRYYDSIVEKNNLCILAADGSDLGSLEERTRALYAIEKVQRELPESSPLQADLTDRREVAEHAFFSTVTATFNRVYYPSRQGLTPAKLALTFEGNHFDGEQQIQEALCATGVSKLVPEIEKEAEALIRRAEDQLWPENQKRVPWRDIRTRALSAPRWVWLPKDGLDTLRTLAAGRGLWRYTEDGYIEKGPFERPRTSVSVAERDYAEDRGLATLEVTPIGAGPAGIVYYDRRPGVSAASTRLVEPRLETEETRLWFLAVDPRGEAAPGEPVEWKNRLTLKHQPRGGPGRRTVELQVVPRGTIRYTLDGANPAEGAQYVGPIEIGDGETTLYCHAEADGVTARREFIVPQAGRTGIVINQVRPARLKRRISCGATPDAFQLLSQLRQMKAIVVGANVVVGTGGQSVALRFGTEGAVAADVLEGLVAELRRVLGDEMAPVQLTVHATRFQNGHDLSSFADGRQLALDGNEVEQE